MALNTALNYYDSICYYNTGDKIALPRSESTESTKWTVEVSYLNFPIGPGLVPAIVDAALMSFTSISFLCRADAT